MLLTVGWDNSPELSKWQRGDSTSGDHALSANMVPPDGPTLAQTKRSVGDGQPPTAHEVLAIPQYVARPPETSNTAPVENEHSELASQHTSAATSSIVPNRPIGILLFM